MKETITSMLSEPLREPNFHNYASYQNSYQNSATNVANIMNYLFEETSVRVPVAMPMGKGCRSDSFTQGVTTPHFDGMLGKREFVFPTPSGLKDDEMTITKFFRKNSNVVCPRVTPVNHF